MRLFKHTLRSAAFWALCASLSAVPVPAATDGSPAGIQSEARAMLEKSTGYLASHTQFSLDTFSTIEAVLTSGQKLQFDHSVVLSVRRPDKLRAERHGEVVHQVFYYDGKSLTLHNPDDQYYATVEAPGTLEEMLDFARESLDIVAPAGDLLYRNAFEILMQDVTSGFVVGTSMIEGARCDHLAFRAPHVDWQIWIREGDEPLPCKFVITSTDVPGAPQFSVVMKKWNFAPDLDDQAFEFTPPADAKKIHFVPLDEGGTLSQ